MATPSAGQSPTREAETIQARSFGGCNTCRSRRIKCDEARPTCYQCGKSGFSCGGYSKNIFFDCEDGSGHERTGFRRPLFTEKARREMSEQLTSSLPYRHVPRYLARLDEESQKPTGGGEIDASHGPFGVFRATQHASSPTSGQDATELAKQHSAELAPLATDAPEDLVPSSAGFAASMPVDALLQFLLDTSEIEFLPFPNNLPHSSIGPEAITHGADGTSHTDPFLSSYGRRLWPDTHMSQFSSLPFVSHPSPTTPISPASTTESPVPKNAVFLLQHFSTTVLNYLTPIRHEKTPWHILILPYVRDCLALLTLNQPVDHAGMCAFHGLLAVSALSLGGIHQSSVWLEEGECHKKKAHQHSARMLRNAYDLPKKHKYKSVLIALQIMVLISTLAGDPVTEEYYFLEAEKLIKLRGLGRKGSRKVRLLHQRYAFERLIYESTCMRGIDFQNRHRVSNDIKSVSVFPYPEDSMAFRPPNWDNLDEEISENDGMEDGEADSGSDILGLAPESMCSKVSGLPKHWVLLLFHIVFLGKDKDAVEQNGSSSTLQLREFLARAKALEGALERCVMKRTMQTSRSVQVNDKRATLEIVLDAVIHSLHIYFYRRIYEVNTSWLQDKVAKVLDCLLRCEEVDATCTMSGCVGVLWASFIASCEAEDPEIQEKFTGWYQRAAQQTGMNCWLNSLDLSKQLWNEKRTPTGMKITWIDILKRNHRQHFPAIRTTSSSG